MISCNGIIFFFIFLALPNHLTNSIQQTDLLFGCSDSEFRGRESSYETSCLLLSSYFHGEIKESIYSTDCICKE